MKLVNTKTKEVITVEEVKETQCIVGKIGYSNSPAIANIDEHGNWHFSGFKKGHRFGYGHSWRPYSPKKVTLKDLLMTYGFNTNGNEIHVFDTYKEGLQWLVDNLS